MPIPYPFDFRNPDYIGAFSYRVEKLKWIRENPEKIPLLTQFYKKNPAQFIIDWGCTCDPRNVNIGQPAIIPFLLFPRQEEWISWLMDNWRSRSPGVTEKSRDMGVSWLSTSLAATLCLFYPGMKIGFASRKEEYVDRRGDPKSLFYKIKQFISLLPIEFRFGWEEKKHSKHMVITFPHTGAIITGEAGYNIGRGDRTSITIIDESSFLERPEVVESALSMTSDCRQDISTPYGSTNPFARKVREKKIPCFTFHWRDDPRKDEAWYQKKCEEIGDPVIIAQELDLNYQGSVEGVVIPSEWIQSAIDAHVKLKINPSGIKKFGFDVADEGKDLNALAGRHGIVVNYLQTWSGKDSDLYSTVKKVFEVCYLRDYWIVDYDADGLGAGVRGDAKNINDNSDAEEINFTAFWGSGGVINPDADPFAEDGSARDRQAPRTNLDFFANRKAQAWWHLRKRFQKTHRAICQVREMEKNGDVYNPVDKLFDADGLISIASTTKDYLTLIMELSQPTYKLNDAGKLIINKKPNGARSPNLADAVMIAFAPIKKTSQGFFDYEEDD